MSALESLLLCLTACHLSSARPHAISMHDLALMRRRHGAQYCMRCADKAGPTRCNACGIYITSYGMERPVDEHGNLDKAAAKKVVSVHYAT